MVALKNIADLKSFLGNQTEVIGCFADTGFLYALSYDDDRLYSQAIEASETLAEFGVPVYANVISRMEFVDLIFRKQITNGAIELLKPMSASNDHRNLFNLLKNIRDQDTANRKENNSFKIGEKQLKHLRDELENALGPQGWQSFCNQYAGKKLFNEWMIMEQELGLNFVEIMEGEVSPFFNDPLLWKDMVQVIADQGIRGPDAMIVNLFLKSKFSILVTGDKDLLRGFSSDDYLSSSKAILTL